MKEFKRYILSFGLVGIILLALIGGFNWLVDPFDTYGSIAIKGFNAEKPEVKTHTRMMKAYAVRVIQPQAVILGSSRALWAIDPNHEGWAYRPVYNLAFDGGNIYERLRYFQHAQYLRPLKQVVYTLDFFTFSTFKIDSIPFDEAELSVDYQGKPTGAAVGLNTLSTVFSLDTLKASINTVRNQDGYKNYNKSYYQTNGMGQAWVMEERIEDKGGYHAYFRDTTVEYLTGVYLPDAFNYDINTPDSPYKYFRKILQIAYQDGVDLRLAISPCHVRQWEILAACGLWPKFEDWKRSLVAINEEESRLAGKTPFSLWDFGVYNELTTEPVPPLGDTQTPMHWYWDSSHYKKEFGDLMLDMIFDYHGSSRVIPDNLGVLMTSRNIESHLQKIQADRQCYRETHPDDIKEIEDIFKTLTLK